jgi:multiple sugar transport system substrate-binding protein
MERGRVPHFSVIQITFNQILQDAFQRLILKNTTPEQAYEEVVSRYNQELAKH